MSTYNCCKYMQIEEDDNVIQRQTDWKSWTFSDLFTLHCKLEEQLAGQSNKSVFRDRLQWDLQSLASIGYGVAVLVVGRGRSAQLH